LLSLLGASIRGDAEDETITQVHNEASRRSVGRLARAITGDLDSLECSTQPCLPDAYARRRPADNASATAPLAGLARTPFSVLRTTRWEAYLSAKRQVRLDAHAAVLRERLPWLSLQTSSSIDAIASLLGETDECVDLPVFAIPDTSFGTPTTDRHIQRALMLINQGCDDPSAAARRLAELIEQAPHVDRLGLLSDAAFGYLARQAPSNSVGEVARHARVAFDGTGYAACTDWQLFEAALQIHNRGWDDVEQRFTGVLNCSANTSDTTEALVRRLSMYVDVQRGRTTPSSVTDRVATAAIFGTQGRPAGGTCAGTSLPKPSPAGLLPDRMRRLWPDAPATEFQPAASTESRRSQEAPVLEVSNRRTELAAGIGAIGETRRRFQGGHLKAGLAALRRAHRAFQDAAYIPGLAQTRFLLSALGAEHSEASGDTASEASTSTDSEETQQPDSTDNREVGDDMIPDDDCQPSDATSTAERLRCHIVRGLDDAPPTPSEPVDLCNKSGVDHAVFGWIRTGTLSAHTTDAKTNCGYRTELCGWTIRY
jgi:hypothetical protein